MVGHHFSKASSDSLPRPMLHSLQSDSSFLSGHATLDQDQTCTSAPTDCCSSMLHSRTRLYQVFRAIRALLVIEIMPCHFNGEATPADAMRHSIKTKPVPVLQPIVAAPCCTQGLDCIKFSEQSKHSSSSPPLLHSPSACTVESDPTTRPSNTLHNPTDHHPGSSPNPRLGVITSNEEQQE